MIKFIETLHYQVHHIDMPELNRFILPTQIPVNCGGLHEHSQQNWREFFAALEPLKSQCLAAGRRLVSVMGEIRASDNQGIPSRRQLYAQHRALSRALMDPDLQNLRRKGHLNLSRLKELSKWISDGVVTNDNQMSSLDTTCNGTQKKGADFTSSRSNHVSIRLCEVITIFDEVDRAARRLEQLTEQRRERLRELTRQRALEDEINEVSTMQIYYSKHTHITFF